YTQFAIPNSLDSLVNNLFGGSGIQISNVSYIGFNVNSNALPIYNLGYFNAENTSLGIKEGIILCGASLAPPFGLGLPAQYSPEEIFTTEGDSILEPLANSSHGTHNAVVLEFDFIPNGDSIFFEYVF